MGHKAHLSIQLWLNRKSSLSVAAVTNLNQFVWIQYITRVDFLLKFNSFFHDNLLIFHFIKKCWAATSFVLLFLMWFDEQKHIFSKQTKYLHSPAHTCSRTTSQVFKCVIVARTIIKMQNLRVDKALHCINRPTCWYGMLIADSYL